MEKPFNPFSLEGKTVLVTGGSSGIGRHCAIACSLMGANVIIVARNEERMRETLEQMHGDNHGCYKYDFSDLSGVKELVKTIVNEHDKIDGFVHCAGIEKTAPVKILSLDDYENVMRINTFSAFELIRHLCTVSSFNDGGSIVLISSISGVIGRRGLTAYSASKGGLISASKVLAIEMAKRSIRVNCVSPGTVLTPMMDEALSAMKEEDRAKRLNGFLLGIGNVSDISNACIYLLSDASRWVTGTNLIVDGGYTCR